MPTARIRSCSVSAGSGCSQSHHSLLCPQGSHWDLVWLYFSGVGVWQQIHQWNCSLVKSLLCFVLPKAVQQRNLAFSGSWVSEQDIVHVPDSYLLSTAPFSASTELRWQSTKAGLPLLWFFTTFPDFPSLPLHQLTESLLIRSRLHKTCFSLWAFKCLHCHLLFWFSDSLLWAISMIYSWLLLPLFTVTSTCRYKIRFHIHKRFLLEKWKRYWNVKPAEINHGGEGGGKWWRYTVSFI